MDEPSAASATDTPPVSAGWFSVAVTVTVPASSAALLPAAFVVRVSVVGGDVVSTVKVALAAVP